MRGTQAIAIGWDAAGAVVSYDLSITSCQHVEATDRGAARIFYQEAGGPAVVAYAYQGAIHPLPTDTPTRIVGATLPILIESSSSVWMIAADGSSRLIATDLDTPLAAMVGTTINVLAHHRYPNDPSGRGTWDLTRYRDGQAPASVTLLTDEYNDINASLVTTAEGAALVSSNVAPSVIVPSQSIVPIPSPVGTLRGGLRDGRTVVFATTSTGSGAVYLYEEVAGAPTFTALDAVGAGMSGHLIDDRYSTSWFAYSNQATGCRIARVTTTGSLDSIACDQDSSVHVLGTRADGAILVGDASSMFTLAAAGVQRVGVSSGLNYDAPILDTTFSPPVLVGWSSASGLAQRFSCLAMHPERCWVYPANMVLSSATTASATGPAGTGSFQHIISQVPMLGQLRLTIVRSIGPGTFVP